MSRTRLIVGGGLLLAGGFACWLFPLFHIQPLGGAGTDVRRPTATPGKNVSADPAAYVRGIWDGPLRTGREGTEISRLWEAFDADPSQTKSRYGRQAGLGGASYFCVRGQGTVETVEKSRVVLTIPNRSRQVCLQFGDLVDNTVREAIGVKASDFANAQDFNAISSELNRRVEKEIIAPNRQLLEPGAMVEFVGCAKIARETDLDPLCLIPIHLNVFGNETNRTDSPNDAGGGRSP